MVFVQNEINMRVLFRQLIFKNIFLTPTPGTALRPKPAQTAQFKAHKLLHLQISQIGADDWKG